MKSKKTFTVMSILIAVLVLGVGYAAVSEVPLNLTGSVNVKANAEFVVKYDKANHEVAVSTDETIDTKAVVAGEYMDESNATMTVNLDSTHRSAYAIYKIVNLSEELKATISAQVNGFGEEHEDYLAVSHKLCTTETCDVSLEDNQLGKNEVAFLKVTVSLTKLPVEDIANAQFTITTKATPVEVEIGE